MQLFIAFDFIISKAYTFVYDLWWTEWHSDTFQSYYYAFSLSASLHQWTIFIHSFIHSYIIDAGLVSSYQVTVSLNNTHSRGALIQCFLISGTHTTGSTVF